MELYNRLNANQRIVAVGAVIVIISAIVSVVSGGLGIVMLPLLGAIAVLAIYWLQYSPNQRVNWPAPVPLLVLGIAAVSALIAVLSVLQWLGLGGLFGLGLLILALIGTAVGSVVMTWGAWQEYQATPRTSPPTSNEPPTV